MKEKGLLFICLLIISKAVFADMPGNVPRQDVTAKFINISSLGNYTLHVLDYKSDYILTHDTLYNIYASRGVPHNILVYAEHGKSQFTDTFFLSEFEQSDYEITFTGVQNNKLQYGLKSTALQGQNKTDEKGITKEVKNFWKTNEILIGVSLVALLGLIVFFIWRKKKPGKNNIDPIL